MLDAEQMEHINDEILGRERQILMHLDQNIKEWMRMALYVYAKLNPEGRPPSFAETTLGYLEGYGVTDILLSPLHYLHSDFFKFRLFGRDTMRYLRGDVILQIHAQIASIVQDYFPGAKWTSLFAVCAQCLQEDKLSTCRKVFPYGEYVKVCTQFDGAWLCQEHKEIAEKAKYEQLRIELASQQTPQQVERQKMSSALRFSILQRDNFTCQACGQSPRKGHAIALHVDHILPIAKGGKTESDNLHALCENCNSGKRDKIIPELLLETGKD